MCKEYKHSFYAHTVVINTCPPRNFLTEHCISNIDLFLQIFKLLPLDSMDNTSSFFIISLIFFIFYYLYYCIMPDILLISLILIVFFQTHVWDIECEILYFLLLYLSSQTVFIIYCLYQYLIIISWNAIMPLYLA